MVLGELGGGLLFEARSFSLSLLFDLGLLQGLASSFTSIGSRSTQIGVENGSGGGSSGSLPAMRMAL
jgi:hypothetical protein